MSGCADVFCAQSFLPGLSCSPKSKEFRGFCPEKSPFRNSVGRSLGTGAPFCPARAVPLATAGRCRAKRRPLCPHMQGGQTSGCTAPAAPSCCHADAGPSYFPERDLKVNHFALSCPVQALPGKPLCTAPVRKSLHKGLSFLGARLARFRTARPCPSLFVFQPLFRISSYGYLHCQFFHAQSDYQVPCRALQP